MHRSSTDLIPVGCTRAVNAAVDEELCMLAELFVLCAQKMFEHN
jgi:hypothetical protein